MPNVVEQMQGLFEMSTTKMPKMQKKRFAEAIHRFPVSSHLQTKKTQCCL
jgi:hypothetical protein